jgi:hypothetical protein
MAWRIALLVGWIAALVGLVALPEGDDGAAYVLGGVPLTVAVGVLVDRWWVGWVPAAVTVLLVGGMFLLIGGCDKDCGGDDGFGAIVLWFMLLFTIPATFALWTGVAARRLGRFFRDLPPDKQHA